MFIVVLYCCCNHTDAPVVKPASSLTPQPTEKSFWSLNFKDLYELHLMRNNESTTWAHLGFKKIFFFFEVDDHAKGIPFSVSGLFAYIQSIPELKVGCLHIFFHVSFLSVIQNYSQVLFVFTFLHLCNHNDV